MDFFFNKDINLLQPLPSQIELLPLLVGQCPTPTPNKLNNVTHNNLQPKDPPLSTQ